jgi:hypothetical protein
LCGRALAVEDFLHRELVAALHVDSFGQPDREGVANPA